MNIASSLKLIMRLYLVILTAVQLGLALAADNITCSCDPVLAASNGFDCNVGCGQDCLAQQASNGARRMTCEKSTVSLHLAKLASCNKEG